MIIEIIGLINRQKHSNYLKGKAVEDKLSKPNHEGEALTKDISTLITFDLTSISYT